MDFSEFRKLPGVYIIGTGTDVGKTYVAGFLIKVLRAQGIHATYYKPACSGAFIGGQPCDAAAIQKIAGLPPEDTVVSYAYEESVSPHLAARHTKRFPDLRVIHNDFLTLKARSEFVVIEGSGGIFCPLLLEPRRKQIWLEDVIHTLGVPSLLVANSGLGTLNATLLTAHYLAAQDIPTLGILLNRFNPKNPIHCDNKAVLDQLLGVEACIAEGEAEAFSLETVGGAQ